MTPRRGLFLVVAVAALVHLVCASMLGLGNDEAYHFLYAQHPSLSYYDHPPLMAWLETASLWLARAPMTNWGPRLAFIALFAGSSILLYRLTERAYGGRAGLAAVIALNLTGYYGLAAATFILPDGPLLFFWLLTIDRLTIALDESRKPSLALWIAVGLAWGLALLSKYHAIFLPVGTLLYLGLTGRLRPVLARPGPYVAAALGILVFSPVLIWNAQHDWASFLFQGGRAVVGFRPRPELLAAALGAQAGYLFPWIWIPIVIRLIRGLKNWQTISSSERFLLCQAVVPTVVFLVVATFRPVLPHWGLIGLATCFPILGRDLAMLAERSPARARRICAGACTAWLLIAAFAIGEARFGWLQQGPNSWGPLTDRTDPTLDFYGWDQVASRLRTLGLLDQPSTFVFTRYWYQSAQIARALGGDRPVVCYNADDPRGFAYWSRPEDWLGKDGVLVRVGEPDGQERHFSRFFSSIQQVDDFWVERAGKPVRRIGIYRCRRQLVAYPFSRDAATRLASAREGSSDVTHPQ